jgi:nitrite reductase (NADH) large subunit
MKETEKMQKYLIIGNGVAGTTAAEHIRKQDPNGSITILSDEDLPFYYRLRLNEYLSGDLAENALIAKPVTWYQQQNLALKLNTRVTSANPANRVVESLDRQTFSYDRLLLATGSRSFVPPIKGVDKSGVFALRSIQDARRIKEFTQLANNIVIIGGGLLGLEAGNALRKINKKITLVETFGRLLPRQLDEPGAQRLLGLLKEMGFQFRLAAKTREIQGNGRVNQVALESGELLPADLVLISAGVRPNMDLAAPLGLTCNKGVLVNEQLQTSRPDVYAAGDAAQFNGMVYGIWPASLEQGKIAGINMGGGQAVYQGTIMSNVLKVAGVDLASAGDIDAENRLTSKVISNQTVYKKIVIQENRIMGCIMLGDTKGFAKITKAMAEKQDADKVLEQVLPKE